MSYVKDTGREFLARGFSRPDRPGSRRAGSVNTGSARRPSAYDVPFVYGESCQRSGTCRAGRMDVPDQSRACAAVHRRGSGDPAARRRCFGGNHRKGSAADRDGARGSGVSRPGAGGTTEPLPAACRSTTAPSHGSQPWGGRTAHRPVRGAREAATPSGSHEGHRWESEEARLENVTVRAQQTPAASADGPIRADALLTDAGDAPPRRRTRFD